MGKPSSGKEQDNSESRKDEVEPEDVRGGGKKTNMVHACIIEAASQLPARLRLKPNSKSREAEYLLGTLCVSSAQQLSCKQQGSCLSSHSSDTLYLT